MGESSMSEIHIPNRELVESAMKRNIAGSVENMRAFIGDMLAYIHSAESAADIALAKEKMGLIADGGGDL
jgi:hypothetical protein